MSWDDTYKRATFHLPKTLIKKLDQLSKKRGASKSAIVREALLITLAIEKEGA